MTQYSYHDPHDIETAQWRIFQNASHVIVHNTHISNPLLPRFYFSMCFFFS